MTTRAGGTERFEVTEVTDQALAGEGVSVACADMTSLQVSRHDDALSGVLLYVIGGVVLIALPIVAIDNFDEAGAGATSLLIETREIRRHTDGPEDGRLTPQGGLPTIAAPAQPASLAVTVVR